MNRSALSALSALSAFIRGKKFLLLPLLLAASSFASVTITGHVKVGDTTAPATNVAEVRMQLMYCVQQGQNTPRVIGTGALISTIVDITPLADGSYSKTLYANDELTCDTLDNSRWRQIMIYNNGATSYNEYHLLVAEGPTINMDAHATSSAGATAYVPDALLKNPGGAALQTVNGPVTIAGALTVSSCTGCGVGGGGGGATLQTNGVNNSSQTTLNMQNGTGTTVTNPSGGNVQVAVNYGSSSGTAAQGNDSRIVNAVQPTRTINTTSPVTGGGDLSADRTLACPTCEVTGNKNVASGYAGLDGSSKLTGAQQVYGSSANTAAQGNDARITGAEQTSNKNSASGYAGLTAGTKLTKTQGDEVWGVADLSDATGKFGSAPGTLLVTSSLGADPTTDNCVKWIAGGKLGDTGSACGSGGGAATLQTNGVNNTTQTTLNIQNGTGTTVTNPSGGNVQVAVNYGSSSGTAAQGNDSRITGAVQTTRAINTTSPITGGGDLSADRTLACATCEVTGNKNAASGYAGIDSGARIAAAQDFARTVFIPYFNTSAAACGGLGAANQVRGNGFYVADPVTFSNIVFRVIAVDAVNSYDVGIYDAGGALKAHTGALTLATAATLDQAIAGGGSVTLNPGKYYLAFTGNATTATIAAAGSNVAVFATQAALGTGSSGGVLPNTETGLPSDAWSFSATTSSTCAFALHN